MKYILLAISLLLILLGFMSGSGSLDFHFHDTYYIFNDLMVCLYVGFFLLLETAVYFVTADYPQWRSIQYLHVISVFVTVVAVITWLFHINITGKSFLFINEAVFSSLLLFFLLGQILFIVNLIAGFIRGKKVLNHVR